MKQSHARAAFGRTATWRKSSYSQGANDCVEVSTVPGWVGVRDSKNPQGGLLAVPAEQWQALLATTVRED